VAANRCQVLAVINGGTLSLHGARVSRRWTRLAAPAAAGSASLSVSGAALGWAVGQTVVVTSTTFNPDQAEIRKITGEPQRPALFLKFHRLGQGASRPN
jgi:hypothetical protein